MSRDDQFAGFASLLLKEIDHAIEAAADRAEQEDCAQTPQELTRMVGEIIARRAYDLVQHTIGYSLEYLDECGREIPGSMNKRIQPSIPDMRQWPEEANV